MSGTVKTLSSFDDFKLYETIGKGKFSKVKLARDSATESQEFAVKIVDTNQKNEHNQVKILKKLDFDSLDSKFIAQLHRHFEHETKLYLVFELVPGGELLKLLASEKTFSENTTKFFAMQIILAIEFLHKSNVVHRDIKPQNMLLGLNRYLKLVDFGFAKEITDNQMNTFCGTTEYLAPEILKGHKRILKGYDATIDWWSVGVMIYEMLSGRTPFEEKTEDRIKKKIKLCKYKIPCYFTKDSKSIIKKFLKENPLKRLGGKLKNIDIIMAQKWFSPNNSDKWERIRQQTEPVPEEIRLM